MTPRIGETQRFHRKGPHFPRRSWIRGSSVLTRLTGPMTKESSVPRGSRDRVPSIPFPSTLPRWRKTGGSLLTSSTNVEPNLYTVTRHHRTVTEPESPPALGTDEWGSCSVWDRHQCWGSTVLHHRCTRCPSPCVTTEEKISLGSVRLRFMKGVGPNHDHSWCPLESPLQTSQIP